MKRNFPFWLLSIAIVISLFPGLAFYRERSRGFSMNAESGAGTAAADKSDRYGDGTPEFLRLGREDDAAFRRWFTFLAESQYYHPIDRLPSEINDCAALIRFAYREALREHDARWANNLGLDVVAAMPDVRKYHYPATPLGTSLFRIRPGAYDPSRAADLGFGQFADAETLQRYNTHLVSRDIRAARAGDLLFYRQPDQDMPFHAMVFLGGSHFEEGSEEWVVYHTGPTAKAKGEIRRPSIQALLRHPEPRWWPVVSNRSFLGVYRWNILR